MLKSYEPNDLKRSKIIHLNPPRTICLFICQLTWAKKLFDRVVLFPSCCYCSVYYLSREAWEVDTLSSGCFWDLTVSGWDGFWGDGAAFSLGRLGIREDLRLSEYFVFGW
ncbi:hypothetical protein CDAR_193941 [Caerostris darwini]|uniref:Uncharacterized protein n=1 Tax=Caerostris darwini TaxID=1538125 RepID=A0AAV4PKQ7_9ARAC|nr:hypothetical protein CDAR_193941 [Caerostris darwini]